MLSFLGKHTYFLWLQLCLIALQSAAVGQTCLPPSQQTYFLVPDSIRTDSALISWLPGNGAGRAIYISQQNSFVAPSPGSVPAVSVVYQGGQQCVYDGQGAGPVWVSGLQPSTVYFMAGYEYCLPDRTYQDTAALLNPSSFMTAAVPCSVPTLQASNIGLIQLSSTAVQFYFSQGNGSGRAIYLSDGQPASVPQNGTQDQADSSYLGGVQCVFFGSGTPSISVSGLQGGTTYSIRIFEFCGSSPIYLADTVPGNPFYFSTPIDSTQNPCDAPTAGVQGLSAVWLGGDSILVDWQIGSGDGQVIFVGNSTPILPPVNGQAPPVGSTQFQGNPTTVYSGALAGPLHMRGLSPGTYYVAGYTYCLPDYYYDLQGLQTAAIQVVVGSQGLESNAMVLPYVSNPIGVDSWVLRLPNPEMVEWEYTLHNLQGGIIQAKFEVVDGGLRWVGQALAPAMYVLSWVSPQGKFGRLPIMVAGYGSRN
jgi:hypothetical protein